MADTAQRCEGYLPISAYAVIGDCHTVALVSAEGSIDWYCPTRFDAPAVFCRMLDAEKGGLFRVTPVGSYSATRSYRGNTNVLQTTFTTAAGQARLTDLMPIHARRAGHRGYDVGTARRILRLVEGTGGHVELEVYFKPTFDYARVAPQLSVVEGGAIAQGGGLYLALACEGLSLQAGGPNALRGRLRLQAGDRCWLSLTDVDDLAAARAALAPANYDDQLRRTIDYWEEWAGRCTYRGPYHAQVLRSVLALKLLTYEPSGAVVAAPTTALPEDIGGVRNWDYRYTWLRDSSLILYALMTVGYHEEAADFFEWLCRTEQADPNPNRQIMYTIEGGRDLPEQELRHLAGYACSQPVRIGNGAARQSQLDIYGEVLTAAHLYYRGAPPGAQASDVYQRELSGDTWSVLSALVMQAMQRWQEPDNGIWEVRGGPQRFLYSRLLCWAALDRGLRLAEHYHLPAPMDQWKAVRDQIRQAILTQGYDAGQAAFTQAFGSSALDATALYIPLAGFLPPTDARVRSTVERIRRELTQDGLVYRYRTEDGLPGGEGTFTLCSLWLVNDLALGGELEAAHDLFERVLGYANDVGLLSEEIGAEDHELLGNFPQGFTHMALVGAAVNLAKAAQHGPEEAPENEAERAARARAAAEAGHTARGRSRPQWGEKGDVAATR